jgi:hypothetical protein
MLPASYKRMLYKGKEVFGFDGKLNNTFKRCGHLMSTLGQEMVDHERKTIPRQSWQSVEPGDACEVIYKDTLASDARTSMIRCVCSSISIKLK